MRAECSPSRPGSIRASSYPLVSKSGSDVLLPAPLLLCGESLNCGRSMLPPPPLAARNDESRLTFVGVEKLPPPCRVGELARARAGELARSRASWSKRGERGDALFFRRACGIGELHIESGSVSAAGS